MWTSRILFYFITIIGVVHLSNAQDADPEHPSPIKLPFGINSDSIISFSPTISADGRTLIFQVGETILEEDWELYEADKNEDGSWGPARRIDNINDHADFLAGPALSYDGNTLYYTAFIEDVSVSEDIYYSTREGLDWSRPQKMHPPISTRLAYEGFPSVSSDGQSIYFQSPNPEFERDKRNREKCYVIFSSSKTIGGKWSTPKPLPENVNTGCVGYPKIMADNRTLLFSSRGTDKEAQYDLYQTQLQQDGSWSDPEALTFVNDLEDNHSPAIPAAGDTMYYFSKGDLYKIYVPLKYRQFFNATIQGYVLDQKTNRPVNAEIIVRNSKDQSIVATVIPNRTDGRYSLILNGGTNYDIEFKIDGYLSQYETYDLFYHTGYLEERVDINLRSESEIGIVVYDKDLNRAIPAKIDIISAERDTVESFIIDDYVQNQALSLPVNQKFTVVASASSYLTDSVVVDTNTEATFAAKLFLEPEKVEYQFNVRDVTTKKKIRTRLTINNQSEDEIINGYSDESFQLRLGDQYEVLASGDRGYLFASRTIVASETGAAASMNEEEVIDVAPVSVGASLVLNNINFASNSAELSPGSLLELDRVIEFMALNPNVSIEVSAHTDDVGAETFNQQLSLRRAQSVKSYLVKGAIQAQRIVSTGYGESRPLRPNDSEINRQINRRVELAIISI